MRLCCEYNTEKIPLSYNMMFVSLIKESLKKVNKDYYERLYNYEGKNNKKIKNFCYSVMLKNFIISNDEFKIKDRILFNVSTPDYEFGINVYNGLLNTINFDYQNKYHIKKLKIHLIKEKSIKQDQVVLKTLSPICIKDKSNNFILPDDKNYADNVNYIVNESLHSFRGYGLKKPLDFEKILMKRVVVKEKIRGFKEVTDKDIFYVNASSGIFKLTGDIEDLNLIYKLGIGFRRSQGFGMIDIV